MCSRQNGQCTRDMADSGPAGESVEIVWGPLLEHTSVPTAAPPCASACDTVGARTPSTMTSTASHTTQRWRVTERCRVGGMRLAIAVNYGLAGAPWAPCMLCGSAPAGAAVDTGTLISVLLSLPLASLNTKVSGTVVSFCSAIFKSISITW